MNANISINKYWAIIITAACLALGGEHHAMSAAPSTPKPGAPAPQTASPAKTKRNPPFVGVVQKVDISASTITLNGKDGGRVFHVNSETRITKAGQPAKLSDAKLGEEAAGTFKDEGVKRFAVSLRLGPKPEKASPDSAPSKK